MASSPTTVRPRRRKPTCSNLIAGRNKPGSDFQAFFACDANTSRVGCVFKPLSRPISGLLGTRAAAKKSAARANEASGGQRLFQQDMNHCGLAATIAVGPFRESGQHIFDAAYPRYRKVQRLVESFVVFDFQGPSALARFCSGLRLFPDTGLVPLDHGSVDAPKSLRCPHKHFGAGRQG